MAILAVNGAALSCTVGSTASSLTVTSQSKDKAESKLLGTIDDSTTANVANFGTCSVLSGPCVPVITLKWTPGSAKNKCSGKKCILMGDTLICNVGGTISITNAGQTKAKGL